MRKYFVLLVGVLWILIAFLSLYNSYAPKVGPIGNGPHFKIWDGFLIWIIGGVCFIIFSITMFYREKKKK